MSTSMSSPSKQLTGRQLFYNENKSKSTTELSEAWVRLDESERKAWILEYNKPDFVLFTEYKWNSMTLEEKRNELIWDNFIARYPTTNTNLDVVNTLDTLLKVFEARLEKEEKEADELAEACGLGV